MIARYTCILIDTRSYIFKGENFCSYAQLNLDALSLLKNFIKLSWSPTRLINLNEASYTSEVLTRAIKTERKAKLNFAKSANDIDIVIQHSPFVSCTHITRPSSHFIADFIRI